MSNEVASPKLFDCFTFYNELDLLELRLQTLAPYVSYFVLVEATQTFTGRPKPLYFNESKNRFATYLDRIIHVVVDDMPVSDDPWQAETHQRNAIGRGLTKADPHDLILVSDVDEIPKPAALVPAMLNADGAISIFSKDEHNFKLDLRVMGNRERWGGPRMIAHRNFVCGQELREVRGIKSRSMPPFLEALSWRIDVMRKHGTVLQRHLFPQGAWHFSFVMEGKDIPNKLTAFSHIEYATPETLRDEFMSDRVEQRQSFFGHQLTSTPLSTLPYPVQRNPARWSPLLDFGWRRMADVTPTVTHAPR